MKCISQEKYLHHLGTNVKTRTLLVYSEATNTINPNLIIKTHVYNVVVLHLFYTRYLQMMLYIQTQKHKENVKHKYNSNNIYHTSSTRLWVRRDFQSILPPNLDTASLTDSKGAAVSMTCFEGLEESALPVESFLP